MQRQRSGLAPLSPLGALRDATNLMSPNNANKGSAIKDAPASAMKTPRTPANLVRGVSGPILSTPASVRTLRCRWVIDYDALCYG